MNRGERPSRKTRLTAGLAAALCGATLLLASACSSTAGVQVCGEIPEGGCPEGRGGSCDDLSCTGLYDCVEGAWTEVLHCADGDAVASSSAASGSGGSGGGDDGAGGCLDPVIDHSGETQDCMPDLLEPDCPAVAAEVCMPCLTGCADFFLCTADGWVDVAACEEDGELVIIAR